MAKVDVEGMIGKKFGSLTVTEFIGRIKHYDNYKCDCDCGNKDVIKVGRGLKSGQSKYCNMHCKENPTGLYKTDLTGKKFNRLLVLSYSHTLNRVVYWRCLCECGNMTTVAGSSLKNGGTKSCGCLNIRPLVNYEGTVVNKVTLVKRLSVRDKCRRQLYLAVCECGKEFVTLPYPVLSGKTKSCGCYKIERSRELLTGENNSKWIYDREQAKLNKKMSCLMHGMVVRILSLSGTEKTYTSEQIVGYTKKDLVCYIDKLLFPDMTWENHGKVWHIDHIKPVIQFVKEGVTDPKIINALSNLQPLLVKENLSKGCKY
jgi:hypothetical protein